MDGLALRRGAALEHDVEHIHGILLRNAQQDRNRPRPELPQEGLRQPESRRELRRALEELRSRHRREVAAVVKDHAPGQREYAGRIDPGLERETARPVELARHRGRQRGHPGVG